MDGLERKLRTEKHNRKNGRGTLLLVGGLFQVNPNPKPRREVNKAYLNYIKTLPCLCKNSACTGDIAPHHTGRNTFARKYIMDYTEEFIRCLVGYIKRLEAL